MDEYRDWINKDFVANEGWGEELNHISYLREQIHNEVARSNTKDTVGIRKLGALFQQKLTDSHSQNFEFTYPRDENTPKSHWWAWLGKLDSLTEQERGTI